MFKFLGWLHGLLFRLVLRLLTIPFRAIWAAVLLVLAMLGEEVRRWAGIVVSGLLVVGAGKAVLTFAPAPTRMPLSLAVLLLLCIWALAVRRAAWYSAHNNLRGVRQRRAFRELSGEVSDVRQRLPEMMARATWGTPAQGAFRSNRQRVHREAEQEARARDAAAEEERRRRMDLPEDDDFATLPL